MTSSRTPFLVISAIGSMMISASAGAQDTGLLLGMAGGSEPGSTYHTYWIAREKGQVRMVADGPDLIVPRRSGFWRVCVASGHNLEEKQLMEWDSVITRRATARRGGCAITNPPVTDDEESTARCHSSSWTEIHFAGPDAASLVQHEESNCGAHYSGGTDVTLISLDGAKPIDLASFLRPRGRDSLVAATLASARGEYSDVGTVDTADVDPAEGEEIGPRFILIPQWGIERGSGFWNTTGQVSCSPYVACGDGSRGVSVSFPAPAELVGHDGLSPSLASIKAAFPDVHDAVSSPGGDLVVAFASDSLLVFDVRNGRLGKPVLRQAISGRIVMAQWAVGRFVPRWSAELPRLLHAR